MDLARYNHSRRISCYYLLLLNVIIILPIPILPALPPTASQHKAHIPRDLVCSPRNLPESFHILVFGNTNQGSSSTALALPNPTIFPGPLPIPFLNNEKPLRRSISPWLVLWNVSKTPHPNPAVTRRATKIKGSPCLQQQWVSE